MKAGGFRSCGGPEKLELLEVPEPRIDRGDVLIRVAACGLNHFDLFVLRGPAAEGMKFPFWGGAEAAGEVVAVGKDVSSVAPGDRVVVNPGLFCGWCEHCLAGEESLCDRFGIVGDSVPGGFAELVAVPQTNVLRLPEQVSFVQAAAVPLVFQTAWRALVTRARVRPGEDVLILGASGGVATAAIQIARLAGARVLAITSSAERIEQAKKLGADVAFDRTREDVWTEVSRFTGGRGVDVVVENVGAATWARSLECLAKGGRLVTYGRTTGRMAETDIWLVFWHQLQILGSSMASRSEVESVMKLVFRGVLQPVIDRTYPLEELREPYERLERGAQFGKIVVQVAGTARG